jgi:hypothetical protein
MDTFAVHNGALLVGDDPNADPVPFADEGASVVVVAGGGADQIHVFDYGQVGTVAFLGDGDDFGEVVFGSMNPASPTRVYGENGSDILRGPGDIEDVGGVRSIVPGIGNVRLYGGGGGDTLSSFSSDTWLDGGSGSDTAYIDEDARPLILANVEQVLAALDAE